MQQFCRKFNPLVCAGKIPVIFRCSMIGDDHEFRVRPGRSPQTRTPAARCFTNRVLKTARASGRTGGVISSRLGHRFSGRGGGRFARSRLFSPRRRVVISARIARHQSRAYRAAPLADHLAYLKREGVSRDGEAGLLFDARADRADDGAFAGHCHDDRHHFRFIISPEDAAELQDLKAFTRDLMQQAELDLGTSLDWVAVEHWNTDNPHVHLLLRGVDQSGRDLIIARDYISHGLRSRAEELVSLELGPRTELQVQQALQRDVAAERWTRLDRELVRQAGRAGFIDLRPAVTGPDDPQLRRLMLGRLRHLEQLGLSNQGLSGEWMLSSDLEPTLRALGSRGDIIKTMHRAFACLGEQRAASELSLDHDGREPIIGRLVDKGLHNELTGEAYAIIDGVDGRAHHVRLRGVEALAEAPAIGGIVEVRRFGGPDDPRPTLVLANRSDFDLAAQVTAPGATWLDHRLVERPPMPLSSAGFGREVRDAMNARADQLVRERLGHRQGQRLFLQRDLLRRLRQRELDMVARKLSAETGLPHAPAKAGRAISGVLRRQLQLTSGRFALIDNGLGFQLVPWTRALDQQLGRKVTGIARARGGIDWTMGRNRGLGL